MINEQPQRPGDLILHRYMPHATPEEQEAARDNLRALARAYMRVISRLIREGREGQLIEAAKEDDRI